MRSSRAGWLLVPLVVGLMSGCGQTPPAVDRAAITAAIEAKNQAYKAAVASRDTNAIVALYATNAYLMPANAPRAHTPEDIRKGWISVLSMPGMALDFTSEDKMISEAGDMVLDVGSFTFRFQGPGGKEITDVGKFVTVFRKEAGDWKIVVDMFNSDIPMTGTP